MRGSDAKTERSRTGCARTRARHPAPHPARPATIPATSASRGQSLSFGGRLDGDGLRPVPLLDDGAFLHDRLFVNDVLLDRGLFGLDDFVLVFHAHALSRKRQAARSLGYVRRSSTARACAPRWGSFVTVNSRVSCETM